MARWQDRPAGYRLRTDAGLRASRRAEIRRFVGWLRNRIPAEHEVAVKVVGSRRLRVTDAPDKSLGLYWTPNNPATSRYSRCIYVAGRLKSTSWVLQVLAHEAVHYEQDRNGKPVNERGVNARAWRLLREYYNDTGRDIYVSKVA